jgi:SRSO17 transposase
VNEGLARGVVLADAAYGDDSGFREGLVSLGLCYAVGIKSSTTLWPPGMVPLPPQPKGKVGCPTGLLRRDEQHQPLTAKKLALCLGTTDFRKVSWRERTRGRMRSRFAAVRVRATHRDYWRGFHHHATLSIAAYGFLVLERCFFPPQATRSRSKQPISSFKYLCCNPTTRPEALPVRTEQHNPQSIATLRRQIAIHLARSLPRCPCCLHDFL